MTFRCGRAKPSRIAISVNTCTIAVEWFESDSLLSNRTMEPPSLPGYRLLRQLGGGNIVAELARVPSAVRNGSLATPATMNLNMLWCPATSPLLRGPLAAGAVNVGELTGLFERDVIALLPFEPVYRHVIRLADRR